jgi:hypothetical protein
MSVHRSLSGAGHQQRHSRRQSRFTDILPSTNFFGSAFGFEIQKSARCCSRLHLLIEPQTLGQKSLKEISVCAVTELIQSGGGRRQRPADSGAVVFLIGIHLTPGLRADGDGAVRLAPKSIKKQVGRLRAEADELLGRIHRGLTRKSNDESPVKFGGMTAAQ